jgi:hypothetical protein
VAQNDDAKNVIIRHGQRRRRSATRAFLRGEAVGGLALMAAAALGLIAANSALAGSYFAALDAHVGPLRVLYWINDGLMALFFLLVGLEGNRELVDGQLSTGAGGLAPVALRPTRGEGCWRAPEGFTWTTAHATGSACAGPRADAQLFPGQPLPNLSGVTGLQHGGSRHDRL